MRLKVSTVAIGGGAAEPSRLVCRLSRHPPLPRALFTTLRRLLTVFITVVAPSLVVYRALNIPTTRAGAVVDVSLFTSNVSSFVRVGAFNPVNSNLLSIRKADFGFLNPVVNTNLTLGTNNTSIRAVVTTVFNAVLITSATRVFLSHMLRCTRGVVAPLISNVIIALVNLALVRINLISVNNNCTTVNSNAFNDLSGLTLTNAMLLVVITLGQSTGPCLHVTSVIVTVATNAVTT